MLQKGISKVRVVPCPICHAYIDAKFEDGELICPKCGLKITITHDMDERAIDAIKKLEDLKNQ